MEAKRSETARSDSSAAGAVVLAAALAVLSASPSGAAEAEQAAEAAQQEAKDWTGRPSDPSQGSVARGAKVYRETCASCHDVGNARTPDRLFLQDMTPKAIHTSLTEGVMRTQAEPLSPQEMVDVAEFLGGRELVTGAQPPPAQPCQGRRAKLDLGEPPAFTNWGLDAKGTHFIPSKTAGIRRKDVDRLALKWAFGFPDSQRMRSQPAIAGGAILVGSHGGSVHALDRETGCVRWRFDAEAEVRTAIVVSPWRAGDRTAKPLAYFGDLAGNVYAVDAASGELAWRLSVDPHPAAVVTGTPALHDGTLYVPVSSLDEASAAVPSYPCCSFRGSVVALDAATGAQKWRTYLVGEAKLRGTGEQGQEQWGPSGVAVWNSPSIDAKRGQLYVATGDNYSSPTTAMSDSIVALDLGTGKINWRYQALAGDAWNVACYMQTSNCPDEDGPDFDFGAGTILAEGKDGRERVLAGQKSGIVHALDPDTGAPVWQRRVGRGGVSGGILFGLAAGDGRVVAPVSDRPDGEPSEHPASPGLHSLDIATGEILWRASAPDVCAGRQGCLVGYDGSISLTPELVLAGDDDGHLRIYDAASGEVVWELDSVRDFETVNGVLARGGAFSGGAAPISHRGNLIAVSGYGYAGRIPRNVLLVFEISER